MVSPYFADIPTGKMVQPPLTARSTPERAPRPRTPIESGEMGQSERRHRARIRLGHLGSPSKVPATPGMQRRQAHTHPPTADVPLVVAFSWRVESWPHPNVSAARAGLRQACPSLRHPLIYVDRDAAIDDEAKIFGAADPVRHDILVGAVVPVLGVVH